MEKNKKERLLKVDISYYKISWKLSLESFNSKSLVREFEESAFTGYVGTF